ncbi:MAG: hypothetical protein ACYTFZ_09350 [Planctomycetota bacterium]|jgi:hypothetical protein
MACSVLLAGLALGARNAHAADKYSVEDQGWRIVEQEGKRLVELRALVVNQSEEPLSYKVQFTVETEVGQVEVAEPAEAAEKVRPPAEPQWSEVKTIVVQGGPLAPGASEVVTAMFAYEVLESGRSYRFAVALLNASTDALLGAATITAAKAAATAAAAAAGMGAAKVVAGAALVAAASGGLGGGGGGEEAATVSVSGSGTMTGQHETYRISGEWVESGSGTIDATGREGRLVLQYTYSAHGPSATSLTATATATGTLTRPDNTSAAMQISSASAQITQPGTREQVGQVITRTGGTATGTFSGTVGGSPWSGVLTMTDGVMTLDLDSSTGTHEFNVQFTASQ